MTAMRNMSNTNISFGPFINIPVRVYAATEDNSVKLNMFHVHADGSASRVGMPAKCKDCGEIVDRGDLARGVERNGTAILIDKDELTALETDTGRDFEVLSFCDATEVNPMRYDTPYFLEPDEKRSKRAVDGYALLRNLLADSGRVGVVRYTMRSRQHLAVLRPDGDVLTVQNVLWDAELRHPEFACLNREVKLGAKEMELATQLMESMVAPFDTTAYVDDYAEGVAALVEAKEAGVPIAREEKAAVEEVGDLLAALERSVAKHPAGTRRAPRKATQRKGAAPRKAARTRKSA